MGCVSSKRVDVAANADEVYRPPPASVAYFDLNTIGEPWLLTTTTTKDHGQEKPGRLPLPILEKLEGYDVAPQSWSEVSKALEDLKPTLQTPPPQPQPPPPTTTEDNTKRQQTPVPSSPKPAAKPAAVQKKQSFRTLEELDAQLTPNSKGNSVNKPLPLLSSPPPARSNSIILALPEGAGPEGARPVSQNSFVLRDKQEREKNSISEAEQIRRRLRRDPLFGLPELCPPGGEEAAVLYTTTLRGVRRTFEDCETARQAVEGHCPLLGIDVDERDVSLHGEYLRELRSLLGEDIAVPRLFVKGRYVGGVEEVVQWNETGRLAHVMRTVMKKGDGRESAKGRRGCEGCGGARFVPCLECNGSCKVLDEDGRGVVRCGECNENGLAQCPICN